MTRNSIEELIRKRAPRYHRADRTGKKHILDEFVALTGYHRKSAIRVLRRRPRSHHKRGRPRTYTNEVKAALIELWELSGKLCSKRLAPFLPELMDVLEREGELKLRPEVKELLSRISPATIDRLLTTHRPARRRKGAAPRAVSRLRKRIPVSTTWNGEKTPGYVELDLVLHCGESTKGEYLHTLNTVDIATSWCEPVVVANRSQEMVTGGC